MLKQRIRKFITSLLIASLVTSPVSSVVGIQAGEFLIKDEGVVGAPQFYFSVSDFDYTVSNNEVILTKYNGKIHPQIEIPATTKVSGNDCSVVLEGPMLFGAATSADNRNGISSLVLSDGVKLRGDLSYMLANSTSLKSVIVNNVDVTELTDMKGMFEGCALLKGVAFNYPLATGTVTDMSHLFYGCRVLDDANIENLDTSGVTDMSGMFCGCAKLPTLDLSGFDTSKAEDMSDMFNGCRILNTPDLSNFDTSKVKNMSGMFAECAFFKNPDVSGFDTSQVTDMSGMFSGCSSLVSVSANRFNTSKVTDMSSMFKSCSSLSTVSINGIDTSKVTSMSEMFSGCKSLTKLEVGGFNTAAVTDFSSMFEGCETLPVLDVSGFNTAAARDLSAMFSGCASLKVIDVSGFLTTNSYDLSRMFKGCETLFVLDLSRFKFLLMPGMESIFEGDINLLKIYTPSNPDSDLVAKLPAKMYEYTNGQMGKTAYLDLMKAPAASVIVVEDYDGDDSPSENKIKKKSSSSTTKSSTSSTVSKNTSSSAKAPGTTSSKKTSSSGSTKKTSSSAKTSSSSGSTKKTSSTKKSSSSSVSNNEAEEKEETSSSVSKNDATSSSTSDHGSASSTSSRKKSSSSEKEIETSFSEIKPDTSSSVVTDLTQPALEAIEAGLADIGDTEKLAPAGNGNTYSLTQEKEEDYITLAKGNKFQITGGKKGSFTSANLQYVSVSAKGLVKAKRHVAERAGIRVSYRDETTGDLKVIRIRVIEPVFTNVGAKKLTIQIPAGRRFDIGTLMPLNASFGAAKNSGAVQDLEIGVQSDGHFHLTGYAATKGNLTLPFTIYGKKFKARIRVK